MNILAFVAKDVGLECLKFLLSAFSQDTYTIVVGEPNADQIGTYLTARQVPFLRAEGGLPPAIATQAPETYDWLLNLWGGQFSGPTC